MHRLPTLTLARAPRLERGPKQLLPEASRPLRIVGRKLDQEWERCHDSDATENGRGSFGAQRDQSPRRQLRRSAAMDRPRSTCEVFFGRLVLAGAFFSVWASDFGRFFPATSAPSPDRVNRNRVTVPPDPLGQSRALRAPERSTSS